MLHLCHAPYSGVRVAAVLEDLSGGLHGGVNIENASYGLTVCAERVAVFRAVSSGVRGFGRILVHSPDTAPWPCGACRQVLSEFCGPDTEVIVCGPGGEAERSTLGALLPRAFELDGGAPRRPGGS